MRMWSNKRYVFTIIGTVLCLSVMMLLNHTSYYNAVMNKMQNMGMGSVNETQGKIEQYLSSAILQMKIALTT